MSTNKIISITGGTFEQLKNVLLNWLNIYSGNLPNNFQLSLFKNGKNSHYVKIDSELKNKLFFFLINYIKYPEGIDYNVEVEGFTIGKENSVFSGKKLLVYISKDDTEFDNVFVATDENNHFKIDFSGKIIEVQATKLFSDPFVSQLNSPHILTVGKKKTPIYGAESSSEDIQKRFKIILIILLILLLGNLTIPYLTDIVEVLEKSSWFIFLGVGLWFFMDCEMLQSKSYYLICLIIAIGIIGYSNLLSNLQPNISDLIIRSSFGPLTLLIVQWPIRQIYKLVFNREPQVDKHGKLADLVSTLILFLGLAVLPFLITDYSI